MKFHIMRRVAWGGVVLSIIFGTIAFSITFLLYFTETRATSGFQHNQTASIGFWWSLLSTSWSFLLIVPHLTYFLRQNGWCASCFGGHQKYNLSSLFRSVIDSDYSKPSHPGPKRPILSHRAKLVLHCVMLFVGFVICISSLICLICFIGILHDYDGSVWTFINFLVGLLYIAVVAFVYRQLQIRDLKRKLLNSPRSIRRVLSSADDDIYRSMFRRKLKAIGSAVHSESEQESLEESQTTTSDLDSHRYAPHIRRYSSESSRLSMRPLVSNEGLYGDDPEESDDFEFNSNTLDFDEIEDLKDENILASQLSGHAPFSLPTNGNQNRCRQATRKLMIAIVFLLLASLVIVLLVFQLMATYQTLAMTIDTHRAPLKGKMIQASSLYDYKLHYYCSGNNQNSSWPTVLIETSIGSVSYEWDNIVDDLNQKHGINVCRYDRAGYGPSQTGAKPRDVKISVNELLNILSRDNQVGRFILVGHGYGSFISRVVAAIKPNKVSGLVLVDALHEDQQTEYWKALGISTVEGFSMNAIESRHYYQKKLVAPLGWSRMKIQPLPQISSKYYIAAKGQVRYDDAVWSENDNLFGLSAQSVRQTRGSGFSNLPLIVIPSGYVLNGTCEQNNIPPSKCSQFYDDRDALGDIPIKLQQDLASLSKKSSLIIAQNSGHNIHLEQPEIIIESIISIMDQIISGS